MKEEDYTPYTDQSYTGYQPALPIIEPMVVVPMKPVYRKHRKLIRAGQIIATLIPVIAFIISIPWVPSPFWMIVSAEITFIISIYTYHSIDPYRWPVKWMEK